MSMPYMQTIQLQDLRTRSAMRETSSSEFLGARLRQGFDWTTIKSGLQAAKLAAAEAGEDPLTEEQWLESPFWREDIKFDNFTPTRAKAYSEEFDRRRYDEWLIERGQPGAMVSVAGFGAMLAAQAFDPINYIPYVGLAGKAAKAARLARVANIAAKIQKGTRALGPVRGSMVLGASEAIAGTIVADAFIIPSLKAQGEDVGWTDFALDVLAGGIIGSAFGGVSGILKDKFRAGATKEDKISISRLLEKSISDTVVDAPVDVSSIKVKPSVNTLKTMSRLTPVGGKDADVILAGIDNLSGKINSKFADVNISKTKVKTKDVKNVVKNWLKTEGLSPDNIDRINISHIPAVLTNIKKWLKIANNAENGYNRSVQLGKVDLQNRWLKVRSDAVKKVEYWQQFDKESRVVLDDIFKKGDKPWWQVFSAKTDVTAKPFDATPEFSAEGKAYVKGATAPNPPVSTQVAQQAETMGIDPKTFEFPEMKEIEYIEKASGLSEGERSALAAADDEFRRAEKYSNAYKTAVRCVVR